MAVANVAGMPTIAEAQIWFDLLDEDLSSYHRAVLMSRRDDLTKRANVHLPRCARRKGLSLMWLSFQTSAHMNWITPLGAIKFMLQLVAPSTRS
jgi:hypothetical protein